MAHEKVYGICDNKCLIETYDKETVDIKSSMPISSKGYIFIGDSYGQGQTPQGYITGWCERLKSKLVNCHANADNIFFNCRGGASFSNPENNYLALLKGVENNISNKNIITDVLIGGGCNELAYRGQDDVVKSNINTLISYVQNTYPNAIIHFAPIGVDFINTSNQYRLKYDMLPIYKTIATYTNKPFVVVPGAENILSFENMMATDWFHPNDWGQESIAEYLKGYILGTGSNCIDSRQLSTRLNGGTFNGTIFGQCLGDINIYRIIFDEPVNNLNSNGYGAFKLYAPRNVCDFPWRAPNIGTQHATCIITSNGKNYDVPVVFNIWSDTYELYMQLKQTGPNNSGRMNYSNITKIQLDVWLIAENV